jgi:hypothetical protein
MDRQIATTCKKIAIWSFIVGAIIVLVTTFAYGLIHQEVILNFIGIGIGVCIGAAFIFLFGICFVLLEIYSEEVAEVELRQMEDLKKLRNKYWKRY